MCAGGGLGPQNGFTRSPPTLKPWNLETFLQHLWDRFYCVSSIITNITCFSLLSSAPRLCGINIQLLSPDVGKAPRSRITPRPVGPFIRPGFFPLVCEQPAICCCCVLGFWTAQWKERWHHEKWGETKTWISRKSVYVLKKPKHPPKLPRTHAVFWGTACDF